MSAFMKRVKNYAMKHRVGKPRCEWILTNKSGKLVVSPT